MLLAAPLSCSPPHLAGCPGVSQAGPSGQRGTGTQLRDSVNPEEVSFGWCGHTSTHARIYTRVQALRACSGPPPAGPALRPRRARRAGLSPGDRSAPPILAAAPTRWAPERGTYPGRAEWGSRGQAGRGAAAGAGRARRRAWLRRPGHGAAARRQGGRGASGEPAPPPHRSPRPPNAAPGDSHGEHLRGRRLSSRAPARLPPRPPRPAPLLARPCRQAGPLSLLEHPFLLQRAPEGWPSGTPLEPRLSPLAGRALS